MKQKGIPTIYAGTQFRSRVEARWAAFFDSLGWLWDYEPFDLAGYIPDFVLHGREQVIVEVKSDGKRYEEAKAKIEASGWEWKPPRTKSWKQIEDEKWIEMTMAAHAARKSGEERTTLPSGLRIPHKLAVLVGAAKAGK